MPSALHVGWSDDLHPDASLNLQLNRWNNHGGPRWYDDVRPVVSQLTSYDSWKDTLLALGESRSCSMVLAGLADWGYRAAKPGAGDSVPTARV